MKINKEATLLVFKEIGKLLYNGHYKECDEILNNLDIKTLSTHLMRSYLVITFRSKDYLESRNSFYLKIYEEMTKLKGKQMTDKMLLRLK